MSTIPTIILIELGREREVIDKLEANTDFLEVDENLSIIKKTTIQYARLKVLEYLLTQEIEVTDDDISEAKLTVENGPFPVELLTQVGDKKRIDEAMAILALLQSYKFRQINSSNHASNNTTTNSSAICSILIQFESRPSSRLSTLAPISEELNSDDNDCDKKNNKEFGFSSN